ncbi:MAG: hypothetical protein ACJ8M1_02855 [Chthoniobacterales bacterium]
MIKSTILKALMMLAAYHFVFPHIPRTYFELSGPQRDNYSRAQRYVYDIPSQTKAIVGSSLSLRFNESTLGPGYYKLCLGGASIFNGLEIIRRTRRHPPVVLIEINQLTWDTDQELLHDLFTPWLMRLRGHFPMFREEGRPANFVNGIGNVFLQKSFHRVSRLLGRRPPTEDLSAGGSALNPALFSRIFRLYHDELYAVAPSNLTQQASRLGECVDALSRDGSICILYEMPIDSALSDLPAPAAVRNAAEARFPKDKYHWLQFPHDHNYDTYDGLHVSAAEADRLTEILVRQVNQISH